VIPNACLIVMRVDPLSDLMRLHRMCHGFARASSARIPDERLRCCACAARAGDGEPLPITTS